MSVEVLDEKEVVPVPAFSRSYKRKERSFSPAPPRRRRIDEKRNEGILRPLDKQKGAVNCPSECGCYNTFVDSEIVDDRGDGVRMEMALDKPEVYNLEFIKNRTPSEPMRRKTHTYYKCDNFGGCNKYFRVTIEQAGKVVTMTVTQL